MQDKIYETEFFDAWIERFGYYEVHPQREYERVLREVGILNEDPRNLVLDLGCGSGPFSLILSERGFKVIGIDISTKMISVAHNRTKSVNLDISYLVADIERLPIRKDSINCIFCGAVLHHLPGRIGHVANEFHRVLSSDGKVFAWEPNVLHIPNIVIYRLPYLLVQRFHSCGGRTRNEKALSLKMLTQNFEKNGLTIFRYKDIGEILTQDQESISKTLGRASMMLRFSREFFAVFTRFVRKIPFMPSSFFVASYVKTANK